MRHPVSVLVSLVLIFQHACAAHRPPPLPSEETRVTLGTIGIFSVQDTPKSNLIPLVRGRSAGVRRGVSEGMEAGGSGGPGGMGMSLIPCLVWSCCVVGGAATGAAVGSGGAASVEEAEAIEAPIKKAFSELRIQETMADDILKAAGELRDYTFYPRWQPVSPGSLTYSCFKKDGIDTALEVAVRRVGFEGGTWKGSHPAFLMTLHARLIRTADNVVLCEKEFIYESPGRSYTDWAHNDAQLFVKEFGIACKNLAETLIEEVFLLYELDPA